MSYNTEVRLYNTAYLSRKEPITYRLYDSHTSNTPIVTGVVPNIYSHWVDGYPDGIISGDFRVEYELTASSATNFNIGASNSWELWINGLKKFGYKGDFNLSDLLNGKGYFIYGDKNTATGVTTEGVRFYKSPIPKDYISRAIVPVNSFRIRTQLVNASIETVVISLFAKSVASAHDYSFTVNKVYTSSTVSDSVTISLSNSWSSYTHTTSLTEFPFYIEIVFPADNDAAIWGVEIEVSDTAVSAGDTVKFVFYGDKKDEHFIVLRREL